MTKDEKPKKQRLKKILDSSFVLTEWEWLKLQLRIKSLETRSEKYQVFYFFLCDDTERDLLITCDIFNEQARSFIEQETSRVEQLEYYRDWVEMEKERILEELDCLPELKREFDLEYDVEFNIMCSYGMGSSRICTVRGSKVSWSSED